MIKHVRVYFIYLWNAVVGGGKFPIIYFIIFLGFGWVSAFTL